MIINAKQQTQTKAWVRVAMIFEYASVHFNGRNFYTEAIDKNIAYLRKVIQSQDFSLLRRRLPKRDYIDQIAQRIPVSASLLRSDNIPES
jgi:hypothetical protein